MSFDLTQTGFSGRTATFQGGGSGSLGSNITSYLYDNNAEHALNGGTYNTSTGDLSLNYPGSVVSGAHEIYVSPDFIRSNASGSNNAFNQIFYTDTSGGYHTSSILNGSYNAAANTFQVSVSSGATNTGFNTGNLIVSNGNGFTTTATYSSQVASGGNEILTYQLGGAPTTSGTYHVYVAGYNVAARGIASTPALNVTVAPPAPCYASGTRIRVLRGLTIQDVPVERLDIGDVVLTASGKPRPIRWIGSRAYPGLSAPKHDRPVRIKAGALAEGVPVRDLIVSPDHALLVDGLLVAAGHLVNGTTITRGEPVADLTYWHIELDSHDLLLAENTPAESFLAAPGVRGQFDGVGTDDAQLAAAPYAKRVEYGPEMNALRERLILRAGLSIAPMRFGAVRAWMDRCNGRRIAGWAQDAEHPDAPVCLDIVVDGVVVAMSLAEEYRADIAAAGIGDGRHGFDVDLDEPLSPGIPHTVEVRRSADGLRVCAMAMDAAGAWTALLAA